MKQVIGFSIFVSLALSGCGFSEVDRRAQFQNLCAADWKDSGYQFRSVYTQTGGTLASTEYHKCQLKINGKWIPAENVKIQP